MFFSFCTTFVISAVLLLTGLGRAQTGVNCNTPCNSYLSELKTVTDIDDMNVNIIGAPLSDPMLSVKQMCELAGNAIQTCYQCSHSNGLNAQLELLNAWWETCVTYQSSGKDVSSAYSCWQSIPSGSGSCSMLATNGAAVTTSASIVTTSTMTATTNAAVFTVSTTTTTASGNTVTTSGTATASGTAVLPPSGADRLFTTVWSHAALIGISIMTFLLSLI